MEQQTKVIELKLMNDSDLPLFSKWLYKQNVIRWYHDPQDWIDEFTDRNTNFTWIKHFIVLSEDKPFGFCQFYNIKDSDEPWNGYKEYAGTYSLDYLIKEKDFLHKGYGKLMLLQLIREIKKLMMQEEY